MAKKSNVNRVVLRFRRDANTCGDRASRLQLLRRYADIKAAGNGRTLQEQREAYRRGAPRGATLIGQCWCCNGWASVYNHHVVQLQNGGTNWHENLVRICGECHAAIHPWMDWPTERTQFA